MASEGLNPGISGGRAAGIGRRAVLRLGAAALVAAAPGPVIASVSGRGARRLALRNLHTDELVRATYWSDGAWQTDGLREINRVLRDFRTGDVVDMDSGLLDLMHRLARLCDATQPFEIISGYRSPRTNAQLARQSAGVAKKSLHMQGRAVDLRLPGVGLSRLHRAALSLKAGGVGHYPKSGFIHIDTGRVRSW
ncbi:MAG: DUF882 domain-containing protein [Rhodospirillales bacterium]|nr:MAG: DUF882 domain-containing protein [Rhodospirillales bacterium]